MRLHPVYARAGERLRKISPLIHLPPDPLQQEVDDLALLDGRKRTVSRDLPPLLHAATTAHRRSVHRLEDRMPAHRRLPSVPFRLGRRKLRPHEVFRVPADRLHPHTINICRICRGQLEPAAELRLPESRKRLCLGAQFLPSMISSRFIPSPGRGDAGSSRAAVLESSCPQPPLYHKTNRREVPGTPRRSL